MTVQDGVSRATTHDRIAGEAASWLAQDRLGTIDDAAFRAWRDRDVAHAIAFARALAVWESVSNAGEVAAVTPLPLPRRVAGTSRRDMLRAAAAVLAVGVVGGGITTTRAYAWSIATTAVGENKRLRLPDDSIAALNTDSRLSWRFSAGERALWVEQGEVALDLRGGPAAIVHGDDRSVTLSQGRFNLRRRGTTLDLLVLTGKAVVHGGRGRPGTMIDARRGASSVLVSQDDAVVRLANAAQVEGITAWQQNEILFQDATLGSAVEEYNRFLTRKIVIVDRELSSIPVGGRFTTTDPTAFLQAVSAGLNIRVSRSSSAYLLTR